MTCFDILKKIRDVGYFYEDHDTDKEARLVVSFTYDCTDGRKTRISVCEGLGTVRIETMALRHGVVTCSFSFKDSDLYAIEAEELSDRERKFFFLPGRTMRMSLSMKSGEAFSFCFFAEDLAMSTWTLTELRERQGLTIQDAAKRCRQNSFQSFQQYENGKRRIRCMKITTAFKFANALGVTVEQLASLKQD